jgi:AcrR family transcriptional regulator
LDDSDLDHALIGAAFTLAAERGWRRMSVTAAARNAALPLDRVRARFPGKAAVLARFGRMADQAALAQAGTEGSHRDRLFDLIMRRLDVLQAHRGGVLALKSWLPCEPGVAAMLGMATLGSMAWMLEAAGISAQGCRGLLRAKGMVGVWLCTLRAWERDESDDMSATMRALDAALDRAARAERWLHWRRADSPVETSSEPPPDVAPPKVAPTPDPLPAPPTLGHEPPLPPEAQPPLPPA